VRERDWLRAKIRVAKQDDNSIMHKSIYLSTFRRGESNTITTTTTAAATSLDTHALASRKKTQGTNAKDRRDKSHQCR
jgi:hypothetical protein